MKKLLFQTLILASVLFMLPNNTFAQDNFSGDVKEGSSTRGADPEIKGDGKGSKESKAMQPPSKNGQSRSSWCKAAIDNYTEWYIDLYVDGWREGYVGPYGDGQVYVYGGSTKLYAKAEFDNGTWKSWGPVTKDCYNKTFTMSTYRTFYEWSVR